MISEERNPLLAEVMRAKKEEKRESSAFTFGEIVAVLLLLPFYLVGSVIRFVCRFVLAFILSIIYIIAAAAVACFDLNRRE